MNTEDVSAVVQVTAEDSVLTVVIDRPEVRNAVDRATAAALAQAFRNFEKSPELAVAVLAGAGGTFCSGADLKAIAQGTGNRVEVAGDGPMGPTRLRLSKPVIAAVAGHAVAGGLELALWCDLRVAATDAVLGVYCRRFGVPLVDGGSVRLPRLVGQSHALDLVLTGRGIGGTEARAIGLVNRLAPPGEALRVAVELAKQIASFPQVCMRNDRRSLLDQWGMTEAEALVNEARLGRSTISSGETADGAARFSRGEGRHGGAVDGTGGS